MSVKRFYPESFPNLGVHLATTKRIPPEMQFSRASTGTYVGSDGLIKTAAISEPRFDHNPLTGESKGLLVERPAINLALRSEELGALGLIGAGVITPNFGISPSGLLNARRLSPGASAGLHGAIFYNGNAYAPNGWQISAYIKPLGLPKLGIHVTNYAWGSQYPVSLIDFNTLSLTGNTAFGDSTSFTGQSVTDVGNGWYRVVWRWFYSINGLASMSFICGLSTSGGWGTFASWNFDGTPYVNDGFLIWGIQIENASFPTSYIPTTTTTITRVADTFLPITLPSSNNTTILVETETTQNNTPILSLNDGTSTNEVTLINHPLAGGSSLIDSSGPAATSVGGNRLYKTTTALSVSDSEVKIVSEGGIGGSSSISSTGLNQLRIGSNIANSSFNGTIKNLFYYTDGFETEILTALSNRRETTSLPPADEPNLTLLVSITSSNTTWNLRSTGTVNYDVDWGDGQIETTQTSITKAHIYVNPGIYKVVVTIRSGVWRPFFNNTADATRIVAILGTGTGWSFGATLSGAFYGGNQVIVMENIDVSNVTDMTNAWRGFSSLLNFPLINTAAGTNFIQAWYGCSSLTSFPLINTAAGTNFQSAWQSCSSLTSFPLINTAAGTNFLQTWRDCSSLTDFPAAMFDTCPATNFTNAWVNCALTVTSIENIVVSINTANTSNGTLTLSGGTNAGAATWTANATTAYDALIARGWTITFNA